MGEEAKRERDVGGKWGFERFLVSAQALKEQEMKEMKELETARRKARIDN